MINTVSVCFSYETGLKNCLTLRDMLSAVELSMKPIIKALYLNARGFFLKTLSFFLPRKKPAPLHRNIENILVIRIDRVGDMVLSTPAFRSIKAAMPHAQLTVLASPANAPILANNPDVDNVIVYDRFSSLQNKIRVISEIRSRHFSLAIDLYTDYELKTACLAGMSGTANRIGYAAHGREIFFNCQIPRIEKDKHFIDVTLDLLNYIGISAQSSSPSIYISRDEHTRASNWMHEKGFEEKKIVAIHPGANYETQRWLPEYYADVICLIRQKPQLDVILFGGPSDKKVVEDILAGVKSNICVYIQDDLRKFLAILSQCHLLVCNNSGPLHCAAALNIPTISFMGPTVKEQWMPAGDIHHVLRMDELPCIGCNLGCCKIKTHDCMRLIRPATVIEVILKGMFTNNGDM